MHEKLYHAAGGERVKELNREHICWSRWGDSGCMDHYRVRNEDAPRDQIEWVDEEGKILQHFHFQRGQF